MVRAVVRILLAIVIAAACGCATSFPDRSFGAIADLETSVPPSRAEGGQSPAVQAPAGVSWQARLDAFASLPDASGPGFLLEIELTDRLVAPGRWRLDPAAVAAELVDDEGRRIRSTHALAPDAPGLERTDPGEPARARWTLVFPVSSAYVFRAVTSVAVHWVLRIDGEPELAITTLFRA